MRRAEGEDLLIKNNVTRGDNTVRLNIIAPIASIIRGVAEKDTCGGTSSELVRRGRGKFGEASAPEDAELII